MRAVKEFVSSEAGMFLEGYWRSTSWSWMNHPDRVSFSENKLTQLHLARSLGLPIPRTSVTNDPKAIRAFCRSQQGTIAKPLSAGGIPWGKGSLLAFTVPLSSRDVKASRPLRLAPCIYQERVRKVADIRVTVVGQEVFTAEILSKAGSPCDWRLADPKDIQYRPHRLAPRMRRPCLRPLRASDSRMGRRPWARRSRRLFLLRDQLSGQWLDRAPHLPAHHGCHRTRSDGGNEG